MPFADIIGHGPMVTLLRQAVRRGRVPQSLIFAGPDGIGTVVSMPSVLGRPAQ